MQEYGDLPQQYGNYLFDSSKLLTTALWIARRALPEPFLGKQIARDSAISPTQVQRELTKLAAVDMVELYDGEFNRIGNAKPWVQREHRMWEVVALSSEIFIELQRKSTNPEAQL